MVVPTNVRAGRVASVLVGVQSAKAIPVDDFTTGSAGRIWDDESEDAIGPLKSDPVGAMTEPQLASTGRYSHPSRPNLFGFTAKATPFSLEMLLRSNWGAYSAGSFALASQVSEWLSFVLVESDQSTATENYHRVYDAFVHSLKLRSDSKSELSVVADIAAERASDVAALHAPASTFDASGELAVGDRNVFPGRLVRVFRDPAGDNQELAIGALELSLDQGLGTRWDQCRGIAAVYKRGYPGPRVTLKLEALVSAETWDLLSAAIAGTKERYRIVATAQAPAKTLTIDLYEVDFEVAPFGRDGQEYVKFSAVGQAHRDAAGNFVTISLS